MGGVGMPLAWTPEMTSGDSDQTGLRPITEPRAMIPAAMA
jgi:hypothetical protein